MAIISVSSRLCPPSHSRAWCSTQAAAWIQEDSCPEYLQKAEDCLRAEEERVNHYLHQSSKARLLERVCTRPLACLECARVMGVGPRVGMSGFADARERYYLIR